LGVYLFVMATAAVAAAAAAAAASGLHPASRDVDMAILIDCDSDVVVPPGVIQSIICSCLLAFR
jgi:hypothetical protein